jgi:hypothetical protein
MSRRANCNADVVARVSISDVFGSDVTEEL